MSAFPCATTKVGAKNTASQIEALLLDIGISGIEKRFDPETRRITGLVFTIERDGQELRFQIQVDWRRTLKAMMTHGGVPGRLQTNEQAYRTAWRNKREFVRGQVTEILCGGRDPSEVFFAHLEVGEGQTLYELVEQSGFKAAGLLEAPKTAGILDITAKETGS